VEARAEFDAVLGDSEYIASPSSLEQFLARYVASGAAVDFDGPDSFQPELPAPATPITPVLVASAPTPVPAPEPAWHSDFASEVEPAAAAVTAKPIEKALEKSSDKSIEKTLDKSVEPSLNAPPTRKSDLPEIGFH